ncbi:MAG: DNA-binding transcriptional regulator [Phycisphaerales bacterium]|jgi:LacI family transcriptional regulator|nr:DNA-binding transcriptional regulator [Phycisphaerales bacterium]
MHEKRRVAIAIELDWPYKRHHEVFAGAHRYAQEHGGWKFILDEYPELTLETKPSKAVYDGIIGRATPRLVAAARTAGVPLVNVWHNSPETGVPMVTPDFKEAGRVAAKHLMARGFERFAFLGRKRERSVKERLTGFKEVLHTAGFSCSVLMVPDNITLTAANWRKFVTRLGKWIDEWSCPIGVSTSYDLLARHVACECDRKGLHVPQDVALVGMHNETVICTHPDPSLTSIDLGYELVGHRAAELLDDIMNGQQAPEEPILLPIGGLIPRRSTDALAVEDDLVAGALRFISEHSHKPIRVGDVATHLHVARRTLERRFSNSLGRSIAAEIARLRVERAKRKLVETKASIKSIAHEFGFADSLQMAVVFNRIEGISPSVYRRTHRKQ